jgi:hypothetical protein
VLVAHFCRTVVTFLWDCLSRQQSAAIARKNKQLLIDIDERDTTIRDLRKCVLRDFCVSSFWELVVRLTHAALRTAALASAKEDAKSARLETSRMQQMEVDRACIAAKTQESLVAATESDMSKTLRTEDTVRKRMDAQLDSMQKQLQRCKERKVVVSRRNEGFWVIACVGAGVEYHAGQQQLAEAQSELHAARSLLQARANEILTLKNQLKDCQLSLNTCVPCERGLLGLARLNVGVSMLLVSVQ